MYKKRATLTSIPERSENEEDLTTKWVPKKKHEVLKAKYKCLKKLFQIYDASVIGILPETCGADGYLDEEIQTKRRRKKRSHRTKSDACAGTTEATSGDITQRSVSDITEKGSIANAVIRDLKLPQQSCTSTQIDSNISKDKIVATQDSRDTILDGSSVHDCEGTQTCEHAQQQVPYLVLNEKRRLTRFQCFIQRILGIRDEKSYKNYVMPNGHVYASSDNNIGNYNLSEKRRRRGFRFRRLKRPKKIQSESALRDMDSPTIMTFVQSVQRNCLMDTTQRQCPIIGCRMVSCGIINYNDHLVLCHFPERKFTCLYCHEGFEKEYDKIMHENEHLGISMLGSNVSTPGSRQTSRRKARVTQTEPDISKFSVPDDKFKKIVSMLEKISDPDQILTEFKKNRFTDSNQQSKVELTDNVEYNSDSSDKQSVSCVNLNKKVERKYSTDSGITLKSHNAAVTCHLCGEGFNYRRQLNLHLDLDHGEAQYRKFHSDVGLLNARSINQVDMVSEDGKINVQSTDRSQSCIRRANTSSTLTSYTEISRRKSEESLSFDPSTNIVYYTSMESIEKPPTVTNFEHKARGCNSYKWEPGTKIIHV